MQNERIFIGLGSNLGHREFHLQHGREALQKQVGRIVATSPLFASPAWGFEGLPFLNQVVELRSEWHPMALLDVLGRIERQAGRVRRNAGYQNRPLDLDLLYYGARRLESPRLTLPHPHNTARRFVMAPLAAIAPNWLDPTSHRTAQFLLDHCPDTAGTWA